MTCNCTPFWVQCNMPMCISMCYKKIKVTGICTILDNYHFCIWETLKILSTSYIEIYNNLCQLQLPHWWQSIRDYYSYLSASYIYYRWFILFVTTVHKIILYFYYFWLIFIKLLYLYYLLGKLQYIILFCPQISQ